MFLPKRIIPQTIEELLTENQILKQEIKVAREAASITAKLVVKQFEETEKMLRRFQKADAERQAVLDAATQLSIIATDLNGTITLFSPGASTLLGYTAEEMVGKCNISVLHLDEEIRGNAKKMFRCFINIDPILLFEQYIRQKIVQSSEWTYIRKDGSLLPINLSITPFYNSKGVLKGCLFTAMDTSSHKLMERELIQAMKNAEAANTSKGDFLARMSHEIRTPMNGVLGMAHLMRKTELSHKQLNYLDKILISANNLLKIINDILDFSKIDAGRLELESILFNLEDVLGHLVNSIGLNAEEKGVEFVFKIDPKVPLNLIGDPLRLGQILMNLAGNAIKFTEHGEIIISVSLDDDFSYDVDNNMNNSDTISLKFSVKDSGIGLYPEQIQSLFDAFTQADDSITRKYGGTGLGLSICRQLVELMGGRIWVQSTPGKGSDFIFTVKLQSSEECCNENISHYNTFKELYALVVDDNESSRTVLKSMLESFNITVDTAYDGINAIEYFDKAVKNGKPYNIVLLDWIMPGIDGIETARRIRANEDFAKIPAMLMVTANAREDARIEAEQAGLEGFLLKPVYASVMYNTILDILNIDQDIEHRIKKRRTGDVKVSDAMKGLNNAHVLLVEDNLINQEVASALLQDAGIKVTIASNGAECLDYIDSRTFDLILMDIQMPVMDGLEAAKKIRNEKNMKDIPIIAMTAHAMAGDREKSLNAGMNGHINKPVEPIELYTIIGQFIEKKFQNNNNGEKILSQERNSIEQKRRFIDLKIDLKNDKSSTLIDFPFIKGIDHETAIKRLNNKPEMLIMVLNDFKNNFAKEPENLINLFREYKFDDIKIRAHTVKGVAGYMGADSLFKAASELELFIQQNNNSLIPETGMLVQLLADNIEEIVRTVSAAMMTLESKNMIKNKTAGLKIEKADMKNNNISSCQSEELNLNNNNISCPSEGLHSKAGAISFDIEMLNQLMELLFSGDAGAADMILEAAPMFSANGFDKELDAVSELIDDIEYQKAGYIIQKILAEFTNSLN